MYNLLVGFSEGTAIASRVVEWTDEAIRDYVAPPRTPTAGALGVVRDVIPERLVNLPTLVMPETGDSSSRQVARIGHIEGLARTGDRYTYRFIPNPTIPEISTSQIESAANELGIADWEFSRTHWAVKDLDLYRVVQERILGVSPAPRVFRFPVELPVEPDLVAVMMPFDPRFNAVYSALGEAVAAAGMRCQRADDIWINPHIMDDIINLIWRARVIIADLSGKNPNVFYEAGIAHTLGRDVIQIAQSMDDVPFDLRGIRSVTYLNNGEGLEVLKGQVTGRLRTLLPSNRGGATPRPSKHN